MKKNNFTAILILLLVCLLFGCDTDSGGKQFNPETSDTDATFFKFVSEDVGAKVSLKQYGNPDSISLEYSTDGNLFCPYIIGNEITASNVGDEVYFRATDKNNRFYTSGTDYYTFSISGAMRCEGNIMYLLDSTGEQKSVPSGAFIWLFSRSCLNRWLLHH